MRSRKPKTSLATYGNRVVSAQNRFWQTYAMPERSRDETQRSIINEADGARAQDVGTQISRPASQSVRPREIGGRDGPDPTRFGDWEKGGRCIDF